jgi:hypothetical protein
LSKIPDKVDYAMLIIFSGDMSESKVDTTKPLREILKLYKDYKFTVEEVIPNTHSKIVIDIRVKEIEDETGG